MIDTVIDLVVASGRQVMKIYDSDFEHEFKDDDSPVTIADQTADNMILEGLQPFGYGVYSEESGKIGDHRFTWVVDGLDATKDFIQKTGEFSIMVGLLDQGIPVLGVVYAPAIDKLYYAEKGRGAYLVERGVKSRLKIHPRELKKVAVSRNHYRPGDRALSEKLGLTDVKMGSIGIKVGAIAEGIVDITYYTEARLGIWDCAASHIILEEAGGFVCDSRGHPLVYDLDTGRMGTIGFIAAASFIDDAKLN